MSYAEEAFKKEVRKIFINPPTDKCVSNLNRDFKRWLTLHYDCYGFVNEIISRDEVEATEPKPEEYNRNC